MFGIIFKKKLFLKIVIKIIIKKTKINNMFYMFFKTNILKFIKIVPWDYYIYVSSLMIFFKYNSLQKLCVWWRLITSVKI